MKLGWILPIVGLMLVAALGDWPYAYYQILRWAVCLAGAYTAWKAYESGNHGWAWIFGLIAVIFNPIAPIFLERDTWQTIDLVAAVPFLVYPLTKKHA